MPSNAKKLKRAFLTMQSETSDSGAIGSNSYSLTSTGSHKAQSSKCSYYSNTSDLSAFVIFKNLEWIPFMLANGSHEFITEGTIGGKDNKSIIGDVPRWSKIYESVTNSKAIEDYRKNKDYSELLESILAEYPWGYRILMWRSNANELEIRKDEANPDDGQPLTLETLLEFREHIPGLSNVPVSDPMIKIKNTRLFKKHWKHVPKKSVDIIKTIMDHDPDIGKEPRPIRDFDKKKIINMIIQAKIDENSAIASELEEIYLQNQADGSIETEEEFYTDGMEADMVEEMYKRYEIKKKNHQQAVTYYASHRALAAESFSYITGAAKDIIISELNLQDYPGAYMKLSTHMVSKGMSDITSFETRCRNIKVLPGMALESFLRKFADSCIEWATVKKHKEASTTSRSNINSLKLNIEEMTDNAGTLSDEEFFYKHGCQPMISNAIRVDILVQGIALSKRFHGVSGTFDQYDQERRTVAQMLKLLHNVENSKNGQDILASEVANLVKNKKLKDDNMLPQANLTLSGSNAKFAKGSCKYHPDSTSHDTAHCNAKNSGGSNQYKSSDKGNKDNKPCTYCSGIDKLKSNAASHTRNTCFYDKASPLYKAPKTKHLSSSSLTEQERPDTVNAFMATQGTMNSSIAATLLRLTAAIDKLNQPVDE